MIAIMSGVTLAATALPGCSSQPDTSSQPKPAAAVQSSPPASPPATATKVETTQKETIELDTLIMNASVLKDIRSKVKSNNAAEFQAAISQLRREADAALKTGPFSVVNKQSTPPSGNKHDYMSMAPYWWPDPAKPDGKPYIQKDGQTNPERGTNKYDATSLGNMASSVETLALAYYLTGNEPYGERAAKLLRTWFLDAETKMNPNMNFGQSVPGRTDGRKEGVLDSRHFLTTSDAVALLAGSPNWSQNDTAAYKSWVKEYVGWLKVNKLALEEKAAKNNHGTWYDAIYTGLMIFSGDKDAAAAYLRETLPKRVAGQIQPDGSMPLEMSRTRSFHYPVFNLEAFSMLAIYGSKVGFDAWNYATTDGKSIHQAYQFLVPYFNGKPWEREQIKAENESEFASYLREAAVVYKDKTYAEAADKTLGASKNSSRTNFIAPKPNLQ
ncbi:alginate lyase family protein [Paenibacillus sp. UNC451MF]|uniref:alginate lyase family protein n=1 Tax=Paenibacillus sp. UNC451MF TaxID=1449063 RepID=UPI0018CC00D6|nr:alginate lyase family protein [Paenibacillus sp. UNC451MF]